jgi:hypothetical protein
MLRSKDGALFATYYHVDTLHLSKEYIRLLRQELSTQQDSQGAASQKTVRIAVYEPDYLGPVSWSFYASAWFKTRLTFGNGKQTVLKVKYSTPRSISSNEDFMRQAFAGALTRAVSMTLRDATVRHYLAE